MKRLWISVALILTLAVLSTLHVVYLNRFTGQLTDLLTQAEQQVEKENWSQAGELTRQALETWENHALYLHTTMHHEDIDAVLISFQEVLAYLDGKERQPAEYAAANAKLVTQISLLQEAEPPTLKNLF